MGRVSMYKLFLTKKYPWDRFPNLSWPTISIIEEFLNQKRYYYREDTLIDFLSFLPRTLSQLNVISIGDISSDDIIDWMGKYLKDKSEWTKHSYIKLLNIFFEYCQKRGFITKSPILRRFKPKRPSPIDRSLDRSEYAKVKKRSEILPLQERTIIEFLDSTAARCGELINIKVCDLDLANCKVPIIGKGGYPGILYFSKECSQLLMELIKKRNSQDYVFVSPKGNQIYKGLIRNITSSLGKKTGIKGSLHPHRFRHTRATLESRKGIPLEGVSKKLRHKNKQTTLIYVHLIPENARFYYERAMKLHENARRIR